MHNNNPLVLSIKSIFNTLLIIACTLVAASVAGQVMKYIFVHDHDYLFNDSTYSFVKIKPSYQNKTKVLRDCVSHLQSQLDPLLAQSAHQINRHIVAS